MMSRHKDEESSEEITVIKATQNKAPRKPIKTKKINNIIEIISSDEEDTSTLNGRANPQPNVVKDSLNTDLSNVNTINNILHPELSQTSDNILHPELSHTSDNLSQSSSLIDIPKIKRVKPNSPAPRTNKKSILDYLIPQSNLNIDLNANEILGFNELVDNMSSIKTVSDQMIPECNSVTIKQEVITTEIVDDLDKMITQQTVIITEENIYNNLSDELKSEPVVEEIKNEIQNEPIVEEVKSDIQNVISVEEIKNELQNGNSAVNPKNMTVEEIKSEIKDDHVTSLSPAIQNPDLIKSTLTPKQQLALEKRLAAKLLKEEREKQRLIKAEQVRQKRALADQQRRERMEAERLRLLEVRRLKDEAVKAKAEAERLRLQEVKRIQDEALKAKAEAERLNSEKFKMNTEGKTKIILRDNDEEHVYYMAEDDTLEDILEDRAVGKVKYNNLPVSKYLTLEEIGFDKDQPYFEVIEEGSSEFNLKVNIDFFSAKNIKIGKNRRVDEIFEKCEKTGLIVMNGIIIDLNKQIREVFEDNDVIDVVNL